MALKTQTERDGEPSVNLAEVHDSMLDGLGQLANYFGFGKVMGQIYGALMLSPEPLCLDDLVERLDISKANVSMNMRTLENMGMVRQVWVRGRSGRRKYYEAETDFLKIITTIVKGREMRDVDRALSVMEENLRRLDGDPAAMSEKDRELAALYKDRIEEMRGLFQFAQFMLNMILVRVNEDGLEDLSNGLS